MRQVPPEDPPTNRSLRILTENTLVLAPDAASDAALDAAVAARPGRSDADGSAGLTAAQEARMRAALVVPRTPLPPSQRK